MSLTVTLGFFRGTISSTKLISGDRTWQFNDMLQDGKIKAVSGAIDKFTETGVLLTDGTELPADLVI